MAQTIITSPFTENRMTLAVSHSSHGFDANDIGKAVMSSGTDGRFQIARANSAANAEVVGVITAIGDVNNYTVTTSGVIDIAAAVPTATAGTVFFLAEAADSQLTSTEPTTVGAVSKPVAVITESNAKMLLIHYRGEVITNATASDTTYTTSWVDSSNDAILRLTAGGSGSGNDDLTMVAGSNITLTPSGDNLTIAAAAGATVKVGFFEWDTTNSAGNQTISNIGFQPSAIVFEAIITNSRFYAHGFWGANYDNDNVTTYQTTAGGSTTNSTSTRVAHHRRDALDGDGTPRRNPRNDRIIFGWPSSSSSVWIQGDLGSVNSDGFVMAWTKTGSPTGVITCNFLAFK